MLARNLRISAVVAVVLALGAAPAWAQLQYAPQGAQWEAGRGDWYGRTQGSRLMPLSWFRALEIAGGTAPFVSPANMNRYRYIYDAAAAGSNLPIGFAEDRQDDDGFRYTKLRWLPNQRRREPWVGMNCAACHTGEITAGTRRLRIDGAPGMGDYQLFNEELVNAVEATRNDPAKLDRFIARIPGATRQSIIPALDQWIAYRNKVEGMNATPLRYGFSRVDAFGHIFNQASLFTEAQNPTANPADAPVSYPFLWNVPQQTRLQWNGSVPKTMVGDLDVGAVGRNFGEVVGVYGEIDTKPHRSWALLRFRNSVNVRNLIWLESHLGRLQPPAWPTAFLTQAGVPASQATIDDEAAGRGRELFRQQCSSCHQRVAREDLSTEIPAAMSYFTRPQPTDFAAGTNTPPGTDPLMACNAGFRTAASGNLFNYQTGRDPVTGAVLRMGREAPVINLLSTTVQQGLEWHPRALIRGVLGIYSSPPVRAGRPEPQPPFAGGGTGEGTARYPASLPEFYQQCVSTVYRGKASRNILGYKARPLNGIWATAPYLHNGSVPTLYDLLLPPDQRPRSFYVGSREFDPRRVGFRTARDGSNSFEFEARDRAGNPVWGNWNGGHDYGNARLNDRDRWDLVEYMKTL